MTEVRFYHLRTKPLEQALPEILGKAIGQGRRVIVKTANGGMAERLNESLWTARPDSFLPHGMKGDGFPDRQPVWLTDGDDNPNGAQILILTGGAQSANIGAFDLCCDMLDGMDADAVAAARGRWKEYGEKGFTVTYWQQTDKGGWEQKA